MTRYNLNTNKSLPYTPKQYAKLSNKKKRRLKLGSYPVEASDLRAWKQDQDRRKSYSWVYRNYR